MTHMRHKIFAFAVLALAVIACSTPKNIVYMQDSKYQDMMATIKPEPIRLKPMDQISIIVNCREPAIAAMFNLPYITHRLGETQSLTSGGNVGSSSGQNVSGYTVDSEGCIDFPILGKLKVSGLTRAETVEYIKLKLIESNQIKDPVVTVEFMNLGFSIIGEVTRPGRYRIDRDEFTIFDAISLAGDLTINGQRKDVTLVRGYGSGKEQFYRFDLTNAQDTFNSPAYYLEQGDVIYVTPNEKRRRESTVMSSTAFTPSFWLSIASSITSLTSTLLVILTTLNR